MKNFLIFSIFVISLIGFSTTQVYGHGLGSETFPPVDLNGKLVTLEVSSSTKDPEKIDDDQQISISLIDFNSKITLRDVTFLVKAEHGTKFLFEKEFRADKGILVFNFESEEVKNIEVTEESSDNFFGSLVGLESRLINVKGPKLSDGGLYKFNVKILTVDRYSENLDTPLEYNSGISIAQKEYHTFNDPNFGKQTIQTVTYYDRISDFNYNPDLREITFSMPFNWSTENINQTSVVHEELVISKSFGDLLVSGFSMFINGVKLSDNVITIDDYFSEERVVHFIINQQELRNIFNKNQDQNGMDFLVKPNSDEIEFSAITYNGQFRLSLTTEPENLKSNSKAKINFNIMDVFLKNKPVSASYDFSMTSIGKTIHEQSGTSNDSRDQFNTIEVSMPEGVSGVAYLNFKNLNGNDLARASIPVVIDRIGNQNIEISIPNWIKTNAAWWSEDQIDDNTFIQGIEYLIKNEIIQIPKTQQQSPKSQAIPNWIKTNAAWWADDQIDDKTFVQGLQYLIQNGIIRV